MEKCLIQIRLFINVLPDTREAEPTITNQLIGRMKKRKTYYVSIKSWSKFQQFIHLPVHYTRQASRYLFHAPIPPLQFLQLSDCIGIETFPYLPGRRSSYYRIRRHIFRNYCPLCYDRSIPNMHSGHDNCFIPDPHIITYHYITFVVPSRSDIFFI